MQLLKTFQLLVLAFCANMMANILKFEMAAENQYSVRKKCLSIWMAMDSHVTTKITATQVQGQSVAFEIFDLSQNQNKYGYKKGFTDSRVVFTPSVSTEIHFCFWVTLDDGLSPSPTYVSNIGLDIQIGKTNEEYEKLAKAEKIKPQELELLRLEERFQRIVATIETFKNRDLEKLATHESTKSSLANFSFFSMGLLVVVGIWQIAYLRTYFKNKRLI